MPVVVLITGEDDQFYRDALDVLRPAGYAVASALDGSTALRLLGDHAHGMVVLLKRKLGQMDVEDFLAVVAVDDRLRRYYANLLLDGATGANSLDLQRYLDQLAVPLVPTPAGRSDAEAWGDLLDALALA